jgi:DNA-binding NtrC family response regulator
MPVGEPFDLGGGYRIARERTHVEPSEEPSTQSIPHAATHCEGLELRGEQGSLASPFPIRDEPLSIGAAPDNDIVLRDRAVSRHHCRIEATTYGPTLRDLDSTNGTWVDGVRVQRVDLRVGAKLRVGASSLRLVERGRNERDAVVASSAHMLRVMAEVDGVAGLPWPVLLYGETGVGKEVVARAIHRRGPRGGGPFFALNMGGLARELVESELFGHERGAFTGASNRRRGAFEQAHGGTLFLDEIAELPPLLQTRLLRALESNKVRRLGGEEERVVDVRVVCATNADLRESVHARTFREDLFYRIHRLVIEIPPLRERKADILPLSEHLLKRMEPELGPAELSKDALVRLHAHRWPGNVRELRNVLEAAAVESCGAMIDPRSVERALRRIGDLAVRSISSDAVREALTHYQGNVAATARALGIPRSTLRDRMKAERIER